MSTARPNVFKRNWMRAHSLVQRTNDFANLFSARSDIEEEGREEIRKSLKKEKRTVLLSLTGDLRINAQLIKL